MFHRILVGVDGSLHAQRAAREAGDLARALDAELTLLGAYLSVPPWPELGRAMLSQDAWDAYGAAARSEAQSSVDAALAAVGTDVAVNTLVVDRRPVDAILDEAARGGHDLVVVGSAGRGDVASVLLGSVSHRVVHECRVPVLVVRDAGDHATAAA